jgi:phage tail sheath protein FI
MGYRRGGRYDHCLERADYVELKNYEKNKLKRRYKMPEYLAPGVYIEEIEIGAKPIEGVSTSTAGFLGYAERGPLDKPTLVTSFAEFERHFGGFLPSVKDSTDISQIRWLAYAVKGFFENGGKRAFITRVADSTAAKAASGYLPRVADGTPMILAKKASQNDTGLVFTSAASYSDEDALLLKDGDKSEFLEFKDVAKEIILDGTTLANDYPVGTKVLGGVKPDTAIAALHSLASADASKIVLDSTGLEIASGDYLLIDASELVHVSTAVEDTDLSITTVTIEESLCFEHIAATEVFKILPVKEEVLIRKAENTENSLYTDNSDNIAGTDFIFIGCEYHNVLHGYTTTNAYQVYSALKYDHDLNKEVIKLEQAVHVEASSKGTWGNSIKISVKPSSISSTLLSLDAVSSDRLDLETITGIEPGSVLRLPASSSPRYVKVTAAHKTSTEIYVEIDNSVTLSAGEVVETDEFDLYITDGKHEEVFKHLSLVEDHSRYITKIVTEKSSGLIRITNVMASGSVMGLPISDEMPGWLLTGGSDGFPASASDIDTIYEGEDSMEPDDRTGLYTFKNVDEINIAAIPGITSKVLQSKLIIHCDTIMKDRFAVLDSEYGADLDRIRYQRNLYDTSFAALYYPWVYASDPLTGGYINVPPSGCVAGIYARTDVTRGVHKAPANEKINGVFQLEKLNGKFRIVNKGSQDILNPLGINCIRQFPGRGIRVWGARTITSNSLWKYVNVRRLFLFMEESIEKGTQWVVFEPNDEKLWARVKQTITQFLTRVWKDGALMGNTPEEAFFVKCDRTTMTQDDIDNGRLIVLIGVAPVKPAEFVIFRIAQWQGGAEVSEEE